MNCYNYKRKEQIGKSNHKNKCENVTGHPVCSLTLNTLRDTKLRCQLLTVCVVFPPGAIHLACFVNAEEELVGRVKPP